MSGRSSILAALDTCLKAITVANGFGVTVATVKRGLHLPEELPERPALAYFSTQRDREDITNAQAEAVLRVTIAGLADAPAADFSTFDALLAAVESALMIPARNPYWETTHVKQARTYEGGSSDPIGIFELDLEITYQYALAVP